MCLFFRGGFPPEHSQAPSSTTSMKTTLQDIGILILQNAKPLCYGEQLLCRTCDVALQYLQSPGRKAFNVRTSGVVKQGMLLFKSCCILGSIFPASCSDSRGHLSHAATGTRHSALPLLLASLVGNPCKLLGIAPCEDDD